MAGISAARRFAPHKVDETVVANLRAHEGQPVSLSWFVEGRLKYETGTLVKVHDGQSPSIDFQIVGGPVSRIPFGDDRENYRSYRQTQILGIQRADNGQELYINLDALAYRQLVRRGD